MTDKLSLLQGFAQQLGQKTKTCNCYDANVCSFSIDRESSWKPVVDAGQPFLKELRGEYRGHKVHLMANAEWVCCELQGGFDIGVCSINRCNRVNPLRASTLTVAGDPRWPVFTSKLSNDYDEALRLFLERPDVHRIICGLLIGDSESLHFFVGSAKLYSKPDSTYALGKALDGLVDLAQLFAPLSRKWNLESLPPSLRSLSGLIQKWAIGDDSERGDLQEESSTPELKQLIMAVEAHQEEIARYRNSVAESDEAALALGTLEECAAEVRLILKRR